MSPGLRRRLYAWRYRAARASGGSQTELGELGWGGTIVGQYANPELITAAQ